MLNIYAQCGQVKRKMIEERIDAEHMKKKRQLSIIMKDWKSGIKKLHKTVDKAEKCNIINVIVNVTINNVNWTKTEHSAKLQ